MKFDAVIFYQGNYTNVVAFNRDVTTVIDRSGTEARIMDLGGVNSYGNGKCALSQE